MVTKPIHITTTTNLNELLDEAANAPVQLERDGVVFKLIKDEQTPLPSYDPEAIREHLRHPPFKISPEEARRLRELVYEGRRQGSRPDSRP